MNNGDWWSQREGYGGFRGGETHQLSPEFALRRGYLNTKTRVKMTSMLKHGGSMVYQMDGVER